MHHSDEHMPDELPNFEDFLPEDEVYEGSSEGLPEHLQERLDEAAEQEGFGATGERPDGKLAEHDEGEIRFGVTDAEGKVIINFGKSVRSVGMTPEQAKELGGTLINRARQAGS